MAIQGLQEINIGLPNESANSDSLYTAFNKTKNNFSNLFANASPTPLAGNGIAISNVSNVITVSANLVAGNNTVLTNSGGAIVIESLGGNSLSTITSVVAGTGLSGGGSFGSVTLTLASSGVVAASYTNPTITIDAQGRITSASNNVIAGTVTSVGLTSGSGISISGGPITSSGSITVTNTGVTRLLAGTGISVTGGGTGEVTVSTTTTGGTVTSIGVSSSTLTVSGTPVVSSGTITVNIPTNTTVTLGNVVTSNVTASGRAILSGSEDLAASAAASLLVTASHFTTSTAETATLAAGTEGQIKTFMMKADGGDMVITVTNAGWKTSGTGTITFDTIGDACTLQYISSKWFCIGNNGAVFA
jgi:hypothetical protein